MKELELYIHIPFCVKKCNYCDFLSGSVDEQTRQAYVERLCVELTQEASKLQNYQISTVFIGGGTPSLLFLTQTEQIMNAIYKNYKLADNKEITMEVNPGTCSAIKLKTYKSLGINRLSFGLQDTSNDRLKALGRIHTYEEFLENYTQARKCGFDNINIDLLSALPDQTVKQYEDSLKKVCRLQPEHISAYSLIVEEGTPFFKWYGEENRLREEGKPIANPHLPSEEMERAMYELTKNILHSHGYERYEISNYARTGKECRHNLGYWNRTSYRGFGLGAASFLENTRFSNTSNLGEYLNTPEDVTIPCSERMVLSMQEQMEETMFLGLRKMAGVPKAEFYQTFGRSMSQVYGDVMKKLISQGLLSETRDAVYLTEEGVSVSNYVMAEFLL